MHTIGPLFGHINLINMESKPIKLQRISMEHILEHIKMQSMEYISDELYIRANKISFESLVCNNRTSKESVALSPALQAKNHSVLARCTT